MTCVFTGPPDGNSSLYAWAWKVVTASPNNGCMTPDAPSNGSDLSSSNFIPRYFKPSVYVLSQSSLEDLSFSMPSTN